MPLQTQDQDHEGGAAIVGTRDRNGNAQSPSSQEAVVAILRGVQPLEPDSNRQSRTNILSVQQIDALATLKGFQNEDIIMLLEACRQGIAPSYHQSRERLTKGPTTTESSHDLQTSPKHNDHDQGLTMESFPPAIGKTAPPSDRPTFSGGADAGDNTPRSSMNHANSFTDLRQDNSQGEGDPASSTTHKHWCTVCENPVPISTCDGWKRHEKEKHEKGYMCMPYGPVEFTEQGPRCAFCELLNPPEGHLGIHKAEVCALKSNNDRKYTRRLGLINHLKTHGMCEAGASTFVDRWKVCFKKRFYACGFCISIFLTNGDRLNHIDSRHYRNHENIDALDPNKIIKGLLLQPGVSPIWQSISRANAHPNHTNIVWQPDWIPALRLRLEMSEEPAYELATDALHLSSAKSLQIIPSLSLHSSSVPNQHPQNNQSSPSSQEPHPAGLSLLSQPSTVNQEMHIAPLHFQGNSTSWCEAKSATMDPLKMHIHPPQTLNAFTDMEFGKAYLPQTSTSLPWSQGGVSRFHIPGQSSEDFSDARTIVSEEEQAQCHGNSYDSATQASSYDGPHVISLLSTPRQFLDSTPESQGHRMPSQTRTTPSSHNCSTPTFSTIVTTTGPAKEPSIGAKLKRRISRMKMGLDVEDVMLHMQDDERSRSAWPADRSSK